MANSRTEMTIPTQSIIYFLLCLFGVLFFVFAGIIPEYNSIEKLEKKINRFKVQIEEEKYLRPLYETLKNKAGGKETRLLQFPSKGSIAKGQTDIIFTTFGEIARKSGTEVISIIPNLNFLTGNSQFMAVNIIVRGDLLSFRNFLKGTGEIPYLEQVEEIEIQQTPEGREYRVKIWLAVS